MKKIIFNNPDICIMTPANDIPIEVIADKDVPSGIYYIFIDDADFPPIETRNFWTMEINESNADGIGLTKEEFYKKYPEHKGWAVQ